MTLPAKCKRAAAALAAAVLLAACAPGGSVSSPAGSMEAASGWGRRARTRCGSPAAMRFWR